MNYRMKLGSVFFVTALAAAACERTTSPPAVADASLTVNVQTLSPPPEPPSPPPPSPPVNITNMNPPSNPGAANTTPDNNHQGAPVQVPVVIQVPGSAPVPVPTGTVGTGAIPNGLDPTTGTYRNNPTAPGNPGIGTTPNYPTGTPTTTGTTIPGAPAGQGIGPNNQGGTGAGTQPLGGTPIGGHFTLPQPGSTAPAPGTTPTPGIAPTPGTPGSPQTPPNLYVGIPNPASPNVHPSGANVVPSSPGSAGNPGAAPIQ